MSIYISSTSQSSDRSLTPSYPTCRDTYQLHIFFVLAVLKVVETLQRVAVRLAHTIPHQLQTLLAPGTLPKLGQTLTGIIQTAQLVASHGALAITITQFTLVGCRTVRPGVSSIRSTVKSIMATCRRVTLVLREMGKGEREEKTFITHIYIYIQYLA